MAGAHERTSSAGGCGLAAGLDGRLRSRVVAAERRATRGRGHGPVLASATVAVASLVDPVAALTAIRRPGEPWACLEQPERNGTALAAVGAATTIESRGAARFAECAVRWRELLTRGVYDPPDGSVAGAGPLAIGGFAFASEGAASPDWAGFAPASLTVPELTLVRRGHEVRLTASVLVRPGDDADTHVRRLSARLAALDPAARLPAHRPDPLGRHRVASVMPPEHYVAAVERAIELITRREISKIVLARSVDVHAPVAIRPEVVLGQLRESFPGCHLFAVGRGEATFLGASPELLVRRDGMRATTVALAGSTRRSSDPAVDAHLGRELLASAKNRAEQEIVTRRIVRALRPHAVWVTAAPEPELAKMANIQHLATPVRAQLAAPVGAIELAGALHPTPAVGGEPWAAAESLIPALEGIDRGWYAAPIGWTDAAEDGEFVVGLRSALIEGAVARCYAGVGVVAGSEPSAELAETETKLEALLPILAS